MRSWHAIVAAASFGVCFTAACNSTDAMAGSSTGAAGSAGTTTSAPTSASGGIASTGGASATTTGGTTTAGATTSGTTSGSTGGSTSGGNGGDGGTPSVTLNAADSMTQGMIFCVPYVFGPSVPLMDYAGGLPVVVSSQNETPYQWQAADSTWPWPGPVWVLNTYPNGSVASELLLENLTDPWYTQGAPSSQGMAYAQILQPANTTSGLSRACDTNYGAPFTIYTNVVAGNFTTSLYSASSGALTPPEWAFPTSPSVPWRSMNVVNIAPDGGGATIYSNFNSTAQLAAGQMVVTAMVSGVDAHGQWIQSASTPAKAAIHVVALTGSTNNTGVFGYNYEGNVALQVAWERSLTDAEIQRLMTNPLVLFDAQNIPAPP